MHSSATRRTRKTGRASAVTQRATWLLNRPTVRLRKVTMRGPFTYRRLASSWANIQTSIPSTCPRIAPATPAIEDSQDGGGDPGKERDDKIQPRCAAQPGADSGPGGAESGDQMEEARETGDADQGGRRDEQQWVCYHTNSDRHRQSTVG